MVTSQQHMYSLIVEHIPGELRSDRALYDYFNRLFPRKVHSTAVVLEPAGPGARKPEEEGRVGRLEKSMVSLEVRRRRPRHVVGTKRVRCCGIKSSPIFSTFGGRYVYLVHNILDDASILKDFMTSHLYVNSCVFSAKAVSTRAMRSSMRSSMRPSDRLPERGEMVDSINYYSRELSIMNERVARIQHEKIELAQQGNDTVRASQWISHAINRVSTAADESTLVRVSR